MAIFVLAAFVLVFINRESEKIVTASIPLAFAAFAALALVFAFAREEPVTRVFPVTFCYQVEDKLPVAIPGRSLQGGSLALVDWIQQQNPKALDEPQDVSPGLLVYHELLQKSLIEWISSRHSGTWRMELLRFEFPAGHQEGHFQPESDAKEEASEILSVEALRQKFIGNRFANVGFGPGSLALPPKTSLEIHPPKAQAEYGEIRFKNWFCEITIRTSASSGMSGVGAYSILFGVYPPTPDYWTQQYIIRITATFSPLLVGHPRMALIKRWAAGIIDGLQQEFDEQIIWRKTLENYMTAVHLPPPSGERNLKLQAHRYTPALSAEANEGDKKSSQ